MATYTYNPPNRDSLIADPTTSTPLGNLVFIIVKYMFQMAGGPCRNRTGYLYNANVALYQMS